MAVLLDFFTIGNRVVGYSLLEGSNPLLSAKNRQTSTEVCRFLLINYSLYAELKLKWGLRS